MSSFPSNEKLPNALLVGELFELDVSGKPVHGTMTAYPSGSNPEGVAVDADGNVYGAVVSRGGAFIRSSRR